MQIKINIPVDQQSQIEQASWLLSLNIVQYGSLYLGTDCYVRYAVEKNKTKQMENEKWIDDG